MENLNQRVFSEVIEILNHTDKKIVEKIPEKFVKFLFNNADNQYKEHIDFYNENWEECIEDDTKAILALIYRDYIVSVEERDKLIAEEQEEQAKIERKLGEEYNPDNIFGKHKKETIVEKKEQNQVDLIEYKEPIFKRIINKIKRFFYIS